MMIRHSALRIGLMFQLESMRVSLFLELNVFETKKPYMIRHWMPMLLSPMLQTEASRVESYTKVIHWCVMVVIIPSILDSVKLIYDIPLPSKQQTRSECAIWNFKKSVLWRDIWRLWSHISWRKTMTPLYSILLLSIYTAFAATVLILPLSVGAAWLLARKQFLAKVFGVNHSASINSPSCRDWVFLALCTGPQRNHRAIFWSHRSADCFHVVCAVLAAAVVSLPLVVRTIVAISVSSSFWEIAQIGCFWVTSFRLILSYPIEESLQARFLLLHAHWESSVQPLYLLISPIRAKPFRLLSFSISTNKAVWIKHNLWS